MLIFNSWALSLSPCDDEMSVLQPARFSTRCPLQLFPEVNFPGNLPMSVFWEAFCVSAVYCQQPGWPGTAGRQESPFASVLDLLWKCFQGNTLLFITTLLLWRLNWYYIGMGAEYNMGLEIYFIPKCWSWLNPSQCREELISLAGLIIYFILTHKKWLSNTLLHLGTAQR